MPSLNRSKSRAFPLSILVAAFLLSFEATGVVGQTISNNATFVNQLYLDLLDRQADAGGLNFWTGQLNAGALSRTQVATAFFTSREFSVGGLYIVKPYASLLNRPPDPTGWVFWTSVLHLGVPQTAVLNSFLASQEFQSTYGNLSNSAFVNLIYQNALGRNPDQAGNDFWLGLLNSGQVTRAQLVDSFIQSPEYNNRILPQAYATLLYLGFLRRTPDAAGLVYWTGIIGQPNGLAAAISAFINSPEYLGRF